MSISKSLQYYRQSPVLMYVQFDRVIREPPPRGETVSECVCKREKRGEGEGGRGGGREGGREREREREGRRESK